MSTFSRRLLLGAAATAPLALVGCAPTKRSSQAHTPSELQDGFAKLEREHDARVGVFAIDNGTGTSVAHRADERFAFCSTFKALAAAAVLTRPIEHLNTKITYSTGDLIGHSPITEKHVGAGMTMRELCDAAVRFSDSTAGNLLLREVGGPAALTDWVRTIGDESFRMDRTEPAITEATPGDLRDTTTPRAFGDSLRKIILDDVLRPDSAQILTDLMLHNTTGGARIRAGAPPRWLVADRTGTGKYGTANAVSVLWPTNASPITLVVMSSRPLQDDPPSEALVAAATAHVLSAF